MNLSEAETLAVDLMAKHGLTDWRMTYDSARRRLGLTTFSTKTISLSRVLTELNPVEQVHNTILHEIAHALLGPGFGHSYHWKEKALSIGCNASRLTDSIVKAPPIGSVMCGHCDVSWGVFRRPRSLANAYHKACGRVSLNRLSYHEGEEYL